MRRPERGREDADSGSSCSSSASRVGPRRSRPDQNGGYLCWKRCVQFCSALHAPPRGLNGRVPLRRLRCPQGRQGGSLPHWRARSCSSCPPHIRYLKLMFSPSSTKPSPPTLKESTSSSVRLPPPSLPPLDSSALYEQATIQPPNDPGSPPSLLD